MDGELAAEYPANGAASTPQKEYGYRDGQMLIVGGCDIVRWTLADHLGTPRMEVDPSGSLTTMRRHDYLPFGEELLVGMGNGSIRSASHGYTADCVRQRFDAYERDNETGLDFAQARYFSNIQGRFTSVDPLNPVIDYTSDRAFHKFIVQPQNWNGYAFNRNNPLKYVDRDGKHPAVAGAVIGFFVGAGIELAKQVATMEPGQSVDWGKVGGAGVKGAVVGGVAGATGGLSLLGYVGASAAANTAGGIAGRATEAVINNAVLDWNPEAMEGLDDYVFDIDTMMVDMAAGALGGLAGKYAESLAIRQAANSYLNSAIYNRGVQTLRNVDGKSDKQISRALQTVQSGLNNFFWWVNQVRDKARSVGTTVTGAAKDEKREPGGVLTRICDEKGKNCTRL
jgi:RHS repeat-associated protein